MSSEVLCCKAAALLNFNLQKPVRQNPQNQVDLAIGATYDKSTASYLPLLKPFATRPVQSSWTCGVADICFTKPGGLGALCWVVRRLHETIWSLASSENEVRFCRDRPQSGELWPRKGPSMSAFTFGSLVLRGLFWRCFGAIQSEVGSGFCTSVPLAQLLALWHTLMKNAIQIRLWIFFWIALRRENTGKLHTLRPPIVAFSSPWRKAPFRLTCRTI